ncbi:MAG TPA: hypothetical protein VF247_10335, partial [Candidatus Krumholzibacteria bacterium]
RTSTGSVIGVFVIGVIVLITLIAITADSSSSSSSSSGSSCPYVYSFDGSNYVLDAEPLSGAISRGLERNDLCRLDHVAARDGRFELMVRNELEETQYLDGMRLRVVDHPAGTQACTDANGAILVIADPAAATAARDENGADLRRVLDSADHIAWQPVMPTDDSWQTMPLRNQLTFSFAKPGGASRANLVVNASTSQWGSIMMREMLQARGSGLREWRESVDSNGPAMQEMVTFNMREELYFLRLYVREGDQWVMRGWLPGGGPAVSETRVIPLDLSGVTGDTVEIRVSPPRGFWAFDYVGMSFAESSATSQTDVPPESAVLSGRSDITSTLATDDGGRHEMKNVGDSILLSFRAPRPATGGLRTIFLDTRGYYESHIDETQPEQTALIAQMLSNEGAIVRYSLQKYVEMAGTVAVKQ